MYPKIGFLFVAISPAFCQTPEIALVAPAGTPLRLYLTKRVSKKVGAPVEAKVLEPLYAFDHQVIPSGATVLGHVAEVQGLPKGQRVRAVLGGDFTPLHTARLEFTTVEMPDGSQVAIHTDPALPLNSLVSKHQTSATNTSPQPDGGIVARGKQQAKDAIHAEIDKVKSVPDMVRAPDKMQRVEEYVTAKLPYHPQWIRKGTRIDPELVGPLSFGVEPVSAVALAPPGTQPAPGSVAQARLITPLDSSTSKVGDPVEAVLSQPVFSTDHKLILPAGTRLEGKVVAAAGARRFHRAGRLRFRMEEFDLPDEVAALQPAATPAPEPAAKSSAPKLQFRTQADLKAAESTGKTPLKVDSEGGVQAQESKTRFLAAAASLLIARAAGDNDAGKNQTGQVSGQSQNVGGRTIGGGFGFGLLGIGIAQSSPWVGAAFGYYGMAWSLYSNIVARGSQVRFGKDAAIAVRFDQRADGATVAPKPKNR